MSVNWAKAVNPTLVLPRFQGDRLFKAKNHGIDTNSLKFYTLYGPYTTHKAKKATLSSRNLARILGHHCYVFIFILTLPMENGKSGRLQKTRYSDSAVPFKSLIDPSEFPVADGWENADLSLLQTPLMSSLQPNNLQLMSLGLSSTPKTHRQTSLTGITDSSLSSGFASDPSSAAASTRFPSFSLASMESLETAEATWLNPLKTNVPSTGAVEPLKRNKKAEGSGGQKRNRRFIDARQRSGSIAAGTVSTGLQGDQQVQRSMSFSVPMLSSGTRQFNVKGNIFRQRKDFSVFQRLQAWKRNGYFIQLEDDSCTGNEDTRAFVLCQLTGHGAAEVRCLACCRPLTIYDHFPLLDGALFLSPLCHRGGLQVSWNVPLPPSAIAGVGSGGCGTTTTPSAGHLMQSDLAPPPGCTGPRQQQQQQLHHHSHCNQQQRHRASISQKRFLHAVCMACMRSIDSEGGGDANNTAGGGGGCEDFPQIVCRFCRTPWSGSTLLIGGLYTYDLFACSPCCGEHLRCKSCGLQPLTRQECEKDGEEGAEEETNPLQPLPYFSQYSQLLCCQHCRAVDYHFIKPFDEMYDVQQPFFCLLYSFLLSLSLFDSRTLVHGCVYLGENYGPLT
ncbi:headcase protein [Echinococcus multilocularis]|uniref:Headcase protein n=1 Tax=Echinococcus multilocularis TaxID=6211 RepID=A0A087VY89_ECHMU|nr:headcase protein [Echinococcus multilocularis]